MNRINLPPYDIKLREKDGKRQIFDFLRRKYVALTPEEWVRQHFVHYLVAHCGYPKGLLANEKEFSKFIKSELREIFKKLRRVRKIAKKGSHDQQINVEGKIAEAFLREG